VEDEDEGIETLPMPKAAVVASPLSPVGAGFVKSGVASGASVMALLDAAMEEAGDAPPRILSYSSLHDDMRAALEESLTELSSGFVMPDEADLRSSLLGFWRLRLTSDAAAATTGTVGYGGSNARATLAQFQMFVEEDNYQPRPTLQTVEVVSDARQGSAVIAALKGDFYLGKLAKTGTLGVVEDYTRREYDDERMGDGSDLSSLTWTCSYLGDGLRIVTTDGDEPRTMLFTKMETLDAQEEIGRLSRLPVIAMGSDEGYGEDEDDDRPMWQRRLDEENEREGFNRFGPPAVSGIP